MTVGGAVVEVEFGWLGNHSMAFVYCVSQCPGYGPAGGSDSRRAWASCIGIGVSSLETWWKPAWLMQAVGIHSERMYQYMILF